MAKTRKDPRERLIEELARRARTEVHEVSPMSQMERGTEAWVRELAQGEMDRRIGALPVEDGRPKSCPRCGKRAAVRARDVVRTFQSLWGTHTLTRNYHYCEACKAGFYPRDAFLGLPEGGDASGDLEARIADFALNASFPECEERWRVHYPQLPLSENTFRQVIRRLGEQAEKTHPVLMQEAALPRPPSKAHTLYVMTDGSHLPCRGEWKEAKLGLLFREEEHARAERGVLLKPRYVAHVGPQSEFEPLLQAAFRVEAALPPKRVVYLADGAPGNWSLAQALTPDAVQILDWYHAVEHAAALGRTLLGEASPWLPLFQTRMETLLAEGAIDALLAEAMDCMESFCTEADFQALNGFVGYCRDNASRMRYRAFRDQGFLIGSGPVESAHRHVLQTRMKKAGQRWSLPGARRMARLRAHYRTAGPAAFHASLRWAYRETLRLKPAPLARPKRRASNR